MPCSASNTSRSLSKHRQAAAIHLQQVDEALEGNGSHICRFVRLAQGSRNFGEHFQLVFCWMISASRFLRSVMSRAEVSNAALAVPADLIDGDLYRNLRPFLCR